jgi:hypothetical protein
VSARGSPGDCFGDNESDIESSAASGLILEALLSRPPSPPVPTGHSIRPGGQHVESHGGRYGRGEGAFTGLTVTVS